jgi:hypothetical protein
MEYIFMFFGMGQSLAAKMKMGIGAAYDKLFENPLLLAVVAGGVILLALWALRTSR